LPRNLLTKELLKKMKRLICPKCGKPVLESQSRITGVAETKEEDEDFAWYHLDCRFENGKKKDLKKAQEP